MKKILLVCCALVPVISMADVPACLSSYNKNYSLTMNGHDGTLNRIQTIQPTNNTYTISPVVSVSAFFSTHIVHQQAQGSYNGFNIIPASYATDQAGNDLQTTPLSNNTIDTVSLPLVLACALNAGANSPIFSAPASIWLKDNTVNMTCSIVNANASVTVGSAAVAATQTCCTTADQATQLCYFFSQDGQYTLLSATETDNGTLTSSAVLTGSNN